MDDVGLEDVIRTDLLNGPRLRLTPLEETDAPTVAAWDLDNGYLRNFDSGVAIPRSTAKISDWIKDSGGSNTFKFGIRLIESDELIGTLFISGVEWNHQVADISIGIGAGQNRGKGYGREAMTLALDFAFLELNLHRITIGVFEYNPGAIHLYESLGFQHEGVYREYIHRDGRRYDMCLMGLLRPEWDVLQEEFDPS